MQLNPITAWSYSRLADYRKCPRRFKYKHIEKRKEPEGPALARGNAMHDALQRYIENRIKVLPKKLTLPPGKDGKKAPPDATRFEVSKPVKSVLDELRKHQKSKPIDVLCELQYAVDSKWRPVDWFDRTAWLRAKLDVRQRLGGVSQPPIVRVLDHKSGKVYPDAHAEQLEIYAAIVLPHEPSVAEIIAGMLYIDQPDAPTFATFKAADVPKLQKKWTKLAAPIFKDKTFKAKPSSECNWCPFSGRRGGPCDKG